MSTSSAPKTHTPDHRAEAWNDDPLARAVPRLSSEPDGLHGLVEAIRGILNGSDAIPSERALAERLNVKRHQLRRALEVMRDSGELGPARAGRRAQPDIRPGQHLVRGTNPLEVIEFRMILEPALARYAALRASPFEISHILRAASTPAGANPALADSAFHRAVAAGSRNSLAAEVHALLRQVARDVRMRVGTPSESATCPNRIRQRDAEHQAIADAIASRDPEAAERGMREHLAVVQHQILARLAPGTVAA